MGANTVDMLQLPVLPVKWYQGPVEIVAITTEGGTLRSMELVEIEENGILKRTPKYHQVAPLSKFGMIRPDEDGYISTRNMTFGPTPIYFDEELVETDYHAKNTALNLNRAIDYIYNGDEVHLHVPNDDEHEYCAVPWEQFDDIPGELIDAALFLDPSRTGDPYDVNPRMAAKCFDALAAAGENIADGQNALEVLIPFFRLYGFPRDGLRGPVPQTDSGNALPMGIVLSDAKSHALLTFYCKQLWSYIEGREDSAIANMAQTGEDNGAILLSFAEIIHQVQITYIPQQTDPMWRTFAKEWLYAVVEAQIGALFIERISTKRDTFTIGVRPGGLKSAMWLHFAEKIYRADNPHEGMRQCKQGGKFHGCGVWYRAEGPNDRSHYCPKCRAKAGAERVARLRNKRQTSL